ncbi:PTS transporter subunit EIIC, partial [Bacillus cereus]|uniref:PTS transporter subunit EIIC n=2 Tax=Bacillaceae TaxID=186817 RepID=UPI00366AEABD
MNYENVANEVLASLGGKENIKTLTHCATRLRFSLFESSKLDKDAIEKNPNILGLVDKNGNYQLIIGTEVSHVYNAITNLTGEVNSEREDSSAESTESKKGSLLDRFLATISAIFTPYIPVLATSGILIGLVAIATNFGWISEESTTYITLNAVGNALLYFFPILLAFTAASRFGANPYIGATIGAALMHPDLSAILISGERLTLLGIPFTAMNFANTVIPIIVAMWAFSYIEKFLKKYLAKPLQFMLVPLL